MSKKKILNDVSLPIDLIKFLFKHHLICFILYFLILFEVDIYMTPLHIAVENGNPEIVQLLLTSKNIKINAKSINFQFFKCRLK